LLGGRVPQYLAGQPRYLDARDAATQLPVESAQAAPGGSLFPDAASGGRFGVHDRVNRLTAAIALVRAAGLRAEAEAAANAPLPFSDADLIPAAWRGHVNIAVARGLLTVDGAAFRPQEALRRGELAHVVVLAEVIQAP
jgi:hypothetical protein